MMRFLLTGRSLCLVLGLALLAADPAAAAARTKITVHPNRYGFLPGYRQPPALTDWRAQNQISAYRARTELRYFDWYGRPRYGFGPPGTYRGRYNGGSFGPCWTSTPIGMMPTCGQ